MFFGSRVARCNLIALEADDLGRLQWDGRDRDNLSCEGSNMVNNTYKGKELVKPGETHLLKFLEMRQVSMIDEALSSLGDYGEVRLVVEKGKLRFLVTQKSFDALKWEPGHAIE